MSKIITITFNPCIDKSTSVKAFIPEAKLICTSPKSEPGGGGINVARAIKKLGGEATAIFLAGGYAGDYFTYLLKEENIPAVIIKSANEMRENIVIVEESTNNQYRFGMPGSLVSELEWKQVLNQVEKIKDAEFIVASGSLPPGVPLNVYAQLARIAKVNNAKFIVDTSGEPLDHAINEDVYLLKPNLAELSYLSGKKELKKEEIKNMALSILRKGKCEIMVVSMGSAGAMFVTKDLVQLLKPPQVLRKSTVGAGDSMVAGIVSSLSKGMTLIDAAKYGVACGTAATMNPGTELCKKEDAGRLFNLIKIE